MRFEDFARSHGQVVYLIGVDLEWFAEKIDHA